MNDWYFLVQSINQSINQKRIRVTKVTNVTARPLCTSYIRNSRIFGGTIRTKEAYCHITVKHVMNG